MNLLLKIGLVIALLISSAVIFAADIGNDIVVVPAFIHENAVVTPENVLYRFGGPTSGLLKYDGTEGGTIEKWDVLYIADYYIDGDGYIEFKIQSNLVGMMVGLKKERIANEDIPTYAQLDYAVYHFRDRIVALYERYTPIKDLDLYDTEERITCRIERKGDVITYKIGDDIYTSNQKSDDKLYLSFASMGHNVWSVEEIRIVGMY